MILMAIVLMPTSSNERITEFPTHFVLLKWTRETCVHHLQDFSHFGDEMGMTHLHNTLSVFKRQCL